ncbi:MAG TPA: amidohydrolase family protein [Solirubrobacteraceae bacterium]|nr:amidohydrolase family protein [Solirubrobacteraceae bacterium]
MRLITLEEHYRAPMLRSIGGLPDPPPGTPLAAIQAKLDDVGDQRLADMDAGGIDFQVLSHGAPGTEQIEAERAIPLAREANDYLASSIAAHPDRLAAFATLPTAAPEAAADELERAVTELGFKGALINGHVQGEFLDAPRFWPIFERAERLGVPIYVHPTVPPAAVREAYYGGLPPQVAQTLSMAGWGWHVDTGLHGLRLIAGGVLDEFPTLQIIIGHMGEALPFFLARSSRVLQQQAGLSRPLEEYIAANFHFTTSGMFSYPPLILLLEVIGADRVMFSVDYPYSSNAEGRDFVLGAPISEADREKLAHANAERLLRLDLSGS